MKHSKTEIFHFSRSYRAFNLPPLDLMSLGEPILLPKPTWKYLGFIFNRKLSFQAHIDFYANKAISTIKYMKILGNSTKSLIPLQKRQLYRYCALSIILYGFQLWYYNIDQSHNQTKHQLSINKLTPKQVLHLKSPFVDIDNRCNNFLSTFALLDKKISPGNHLHDNFSDCFSFYSCLHNTKNQLCKHLWTLLWK